MTITEVYQIYGFRVTRRAFHRWILDNKDGSSRLLYEKMAKKHELKEDEYATYVDELEHDNVSDEYSDLDAEIHYQIFPHLYEITHDINNDLLIGIKIATFKFEYALDTIDPETSLPFMICDGENLEAFGDIDLTSAYETYPFLTGKPPKIYLLQNDCCCCS